MHNFQQLHIMTSCLVSVYTDFPPLIMQRLR